MAKKKVTKTKSVPPKESSRTKKGKKTVVKKKVKAAKKVVKKAAKPAPSKGGKTTKAGSKNAKIKKVATKKVVAKKAKKQAAKPTRVVANKKKAKTAKPKAIKKAKKVIAKKAVKPAAKKKIAKPVKAKATKKAAVKPTSSVKVKVKTIIKTAPKTQKAKEITQVKETITTKPVTISVPKVALNPFENKSNKTVSEKLAEAAVNGILDKKGKNVSILNLTEIQNRVCDIFIICQADSNTQVNAIADSVIEKVREDAGEKPYRSEGFQNSEWILIDYVNVVVHVFQSQIRDFYNLEGLWADAQETKVAYE